VLTDPCPYCAGSSVIKSSSTICYEILAEVKKISADLDGQSLVLRVNPDIARALRDEERAVFKDLKQSLGKEIALKPDVQLHHEQFDLMAIG
jgi:ribonuclease G